MSHRPPRGPRRMAALMLVVQLMLLLFTALPLPAPAAAGRASAPDTGLWAMVCSPQGMKRVPLQQLTATDSAPDPAQAADPPHGSHCLLCQQQHSPALPALALPPCPPATAAATTTPQWRAAPPRSAAHLWRPLLARAPPFQG
ncbi:DUF2946 family protein [Xenophilus sp. Marseille-Q4582]|uniref:DUF2946 family protein n=1 Tax=Xenophilus sp. Marseille-Q4582 TaxID=2866600 RepID=UPI001CE3ED76|nr:DUF2946 family protein [Xenophilus sp. Marseille-Q4582]